MPKTPYAPSSPSKASVPRRVWSSTAWMSLGRLWGSLCTLVTLWVLAEPLGSAGFGRLTFYLAMFLVLDAVVDLGTGQAALRSGAQDPERIAPVLVRARRTRLVLGLLAAGGTTLAAILAQEPGAGWIALASLYPISHVLELSTLGLRNQIRWGRLVLVRAGAASVSLLFVIALNAFDERRPAVYLAGIAAGSTLGNLALHRVSRPFLPATRQVQPAPLRPFLRLALPMGLAALCQQLYFWQDNLFLRAMHGDTVLGPYNLAVRCMSYGILLAVYASSAALPWLTREADEHRLGDALARLSAPLLAPAALGAGLAWPWTESILGLFGDEFRVAGPSLRWLLLSVLAVYLGAPWLTGVVALGRSGAVLGIALGGLLVNTVGNFVWVPGEGALGAARATFFTECAVATFAGMVLVRAGAAPLGRTHTAHNALRLVLAGAMFFVGRWIATPA